MLIDIASKASSDEAMLIFCANEKTPQVFVDDPVIKNECLQFYKDQIWDFDKKTSYEWFLISKRGKKAVRMIAFCLAKDENELKGDGLRAAAHLFPKFFRAIKSLQIDLSQLKALAAFLDIEKEDVLRCLAEGLFLSAYRFDRYKKKDKDVPKLKKVVFITQVKGAKKIVSRAELSCTGTLWARDLLNEPGNKLRPPDLSKWAKAQGRKYNVKVSVFRRSQLETMNMGGILAVNQGSDIEPQLIQCEYKPKSYKKTLLLVGKGVTFDTGGINLKPYVSIGKIGSMKMDMGGAAVALCSVFAASRLQLPLRVIVLAPAVENMISGSAMRPGDIITMTDGTTVEVDNTDAEGRLILADALSYGIAQFKPDLTIDLATLTGACVVALGHQAAALYSTDKKSTEKLLQCAQKTGERVWAMPLFPEYAEQLKSEVADLVNVGGKAAGSITAAKFLEHFTHDTAWMHLDIAGTAMLEFPVGYQPKGGTGYGVRLLLEFMENHFS